MSPNPNSTATTIGQHKTGTTIFKLLNKTTKATKATAVPTAAAGNMQEKKINRSNSLVNTALKWIPLLNQHYNQNNNSGGGGGIDSGGGGCIKHFGSTVAVQKLRESKWFNSDEKKIFCAVIECGFIVEIRGEINPATTTTTTSATVSEDDEDNENSDENIYKKINSEGRLQKIFKPTTSSKLLENCDNEPMFTTAATTMSSTDSWFGVVLCKTLKDNKPKPETIEIFSVKIRQNGVRVYKTSLETIWNNNWRIRINNFADREKTPHCEKDIKNQISFARKARYSLWHNSKHFAYWCRYGSRQQDVRKRQMSECVKWGSVGMNAGMLLIMNNRQRSYTTSK